MAKRIRILPAILTDSPAMLEKLIRQTESFTDFAQLDIMDGKFVPSNSVSSEDISKIKPKLNWEAHLMVLEPEKYLEAFKNARAQKIVFHYEATHSPGKIIQSIRKLGMQAGLAINPETHIAEIESLAGQVDSVLFLSVNPGFYGAKFIPEVLDKITEFRKVHPKMETGIDGGIKEGNVAQIASSGVDVICVGSAIFREPDPAASYRRLLELATTASV